MTAPRLISRRPEDVKAELVFSFSNAVDPLLSDAASGAFWSERDAERRVWTVMLPICAQLMAAVFSAMCRRATEEALTATGRTMGDVSMRMDAVIRLMTTFGRVCFPTWSFRDARGGATTCPAKALFPMHPQSRSSMHCMEWESALAADHPFRRAASALLFFTHDAVDLEDTTIERHAVRAGERMSRDWMYNTSTEIRTILRERATRDLTTGRPLVYASTDAHALSMYPDWTWDSAYQMWNGIRLWCIDRTTGRIIHLGGDYANDDCRGVAARFVGLQEGRQLPADGDYGEGVVAQIVFPSDGALWIVDHVLPLFPGAVAVLDVYHVLEKVTEFAANAFARSKKRQRRLFAAALRALGLPARRPRQKGVARKGPSTKKKAAKGRRSPNGSGARLREMLNKTPRPANREAAKKCDSVEAFITKNVDRMNYGDMDKRGMQIGSGAMESIHRSGSQVRLKRSGCHWTNDTAQAILNLRMLGLSGRWDEYWGNPDLALRMASRGVT